MDNSNTSVPDRGDITVGVGPDGSSETLELVRSDDSSESQVGARAIGAARDDLRDAVWADQLWY